MNIEIIENQVRWREIAGEWESLQAACGNELPFMAWHYLDAVWKVFCAPEAKRPRRPFILTAWDEGGRLAGALPLAVGFPRSGPRRWVRHLGFLGTIVDTMAEEHGFLARPESSRAVAEEFAARICGPMRSKWDTLFFSAVEEDDPGMGRLIEALRGRGLAVSVRGLDPAPYHVFEERGDDMFKAFSKNLRGHLRKAHSRLKRLELEMVVKAGGRDVDLDEALDIVIDLHNDRFNAGRDNSAQDTFHRLLHRELKERHQAEVILLEINDEVAGGFYCYLYAKRCWAVLFGWDQNLAHLSLGNLSTAAMLRHLGDGDCTRFEFGGGGGEYKERWFKKKRPLVAYEAVNWRQPGGAVFGAAKRLNDALRRMKRNGPAR